MKPHQLRVVNEKEELDEKICALHKFIGGGVYLSLPKEERCRMDRQIEAMKIYSSVLGERISAFS